MLVVPLLQWMAFARIFYPISVINMSILNAMGRSDLFLKLDLAKFPLIAISLIISIPLGVKAMVISQVITTFIGFFINAYLPGKHFGYGAIGQIKDMMPIIISTGIMALIVYFSVYNVESSILKILIGGFVAIVSYLLSSSLFKSDGYLLILQEVKPFILKLKNSVRK